MTANRQKLKFILASGSPRRKELLSLTEVAFKILPADVDESQFGNEDPSSYVSRVSENKARATSNNLDVPAIVIAADTTVVHNGMILGKPTGSQNAIEVLRSLRANSHTVVTGLTVSIKSAEGEVEIHSDLASTTVEMRNYSDAEIERYVETGNPLDKAGSYAIQHDEFHPVKNIVGCFANVVGLPLCHLTRNLIKAGVALENSFGEKVAQNCQDHFNYECPVFEDVLQGEL